MCHRLPTVKSRLKVCLRTHGVSPIDTPRRTVYVHHMPQVSAHDNLVTIEEAANLLNVSVRTVFRLQSDGALPPVYLHPVRKAKIRRFRRSDVEALLTRGAA